MLVGYCPNERFLKLDRTQLFTGPSVLLQESQQVKAEGTH